MAEHHISEEHLTYAINAVENTGMPFDLTAISTQFDNNQELKQKLQDETATATDVTDEFYYAVMNHFNTMFSLSGENESYIPENEEMNTIIDNQIITNLEDFVIFIKYNFLKAVYYNELNNIDLGKEIIIKMMIVIKQNENIIIESLENLIGFNQNSSLSEGYFEMIPEE